MLIGGDNIVFELMNELFKIKKVWELAAEVSEIATRACRFVSIDRVISILDELDKVKNSEEAIEKLKEIKAELEKIVEEGEKEFCKKLKVKLLDLYTKHWKEEAEEEIEKAVKSVIKRIDPKIDTKQFAEEIYEILADNLLDIGEDSIDDIIDIVRSIEVKLDE